MKIGDVMLASICGLVIVVSALQYHSFHSPNSSTQVEQKTK